MHFAGDGPLISDADGAATVSAKMKGALGRSSCTNPLPSHVVAPQIDLDHGGSNSWLKAIGPAGPLKVRVRNFDKSVAAIKALGPVATPQKLLGGLALAKTLAKTESDGALTWLAEYGADGAIKVNGMPLGKAPK